MSWSEAKIKKSFAGLDVSECNLLTFELYYPESFHGFKTKVFAKNNESGTEIINKEGNMESSDAGDFVEITSAAGEGASADISQMEGEVMLADGNATESIKALYSYLKSLEIKTVQKFHCGRSGIMLK